MLKKLGPGLLVAAAGIGAGDMILGIQIGIDFKWVFVFAVLLTAILKYVITEGIARHQLASRKSVIHFWNEKIPLGLRLFFMLFFVVWSFMVGAALLSASGVAAHSFLPFLGKNHWAIVHSLLAFLMIYFGRYQSVENLTKVLILLLFVILIPTAILLFFKTDVVPSNGSVYDVPTLIMSIIGGVGGSVTMLSYTYWLQEKKWIGKEHITNVRFDLKFSYFITAIFIFAVMVISSRLKLETYESSGSEMIFALGEVIGSVLGNTGQLLFKICFWGVAFSSVITVWSGVPYLFVDFYKGITKREIVQEASIDKSKAYRAFLLFISIAPLVLTFLQNTIKNVINYTLISSVFVVGISLTLLLINNDKVRMGDLVNKTFTKVILLIGLLVFASLLLWQLVY